MADSTLILTTAEVRDRMSLQNLQDINDAIDSGLVAAHTFIEGLLRSPFTPVTGEVDIFFLDSTIQDPHNNLYRCCLSRMFLSAVTSVKIADSRKEVLDDTLNADLDPADYVIDTMKGLFFVEKDYSDKFIRITYSAGLNDANPAPYWLKEAVLAFMPSVLLSQADKDIKAIRDTVTTAHKMTTDMVAPYLRATALQFMPIY